MVVSSLPPLPTPIEPVVPLIPSPSTSAYSAPPSACSSSAIKTEKSENIVKIEKSTASSSSANPVLVIDDELKIEDLGSEEFVDSPVAGSSSTTFIARERDPAGETAEMREIRKRRLQKFQQSEY